MAHSTSRAPSTGTPLSGGTGRILNGLSLVVAILAVAIALVLPGPAGPRGPQGDPGLPGSGSGLIISSTNTTTHLDIETSCTHWAASEVSITVPGPGTMLVQGSVVLGVAHATGTRDGIWVKLSDAPTDCVDSPEVSVAVVIEQEPAGAYYPTLPVTRAFPIASAGTFTYGLNGIAIFGGPGDAFFSAVVVAVFYPS